MEREWPNGKPGNRRTGPARGTHSGKRRGTLPATKDPIILKRRELAAPLWNRGYTASQILSRINVWLESEGERPVSLQTIYKDHSAILAQWRQEYEASLDDARTSHIASLQRAKRSAWEDYDTARDDGKSTVGILNLIRQIDLDLSRLDGSLTHHLDVTTNGETLDAAPPLNLGGLTDDELDLLEGLITRASAEDPERAS